MLLLGKLRNPNRVKVKILATDLSTRVLDIAKRGHYGEERVKNIPPGSAQQVRHKRKERLGRTLLDCPRCAFVHYFRKTESHGIVADERPVRHDLLPQCDDLF
jgi:hypothetical protein